MIERISILLTERTLPAVPKTASTQSQRNKSSRLHQLDKGAASSRSQTKLSYGPLFQRGLLQERAAGADLAYGKNAKGACWKIALEQ